MIPDWLAARRAQAARDAEEAALPSEALEVWRYSPIDELDLSAYAPITAGSTPGPGVDHRLLPADRAALVVVRDDAIVLVEVSDVATSAGLQIRAFADLDAAPKHLGASVSEPDAFTLRNDALGDAGVLVSVPRNAVIELPIVIVHDISAGASLTFPRVLIEAEMSSEVTVLDLAISDDVVALSIPVIEIHVAENAAVRYESVQDLGPRVWQIGTTGARVERDGRLTCSAVALGGGYARTRLDSKVTGAGGTAELVAAYFGSGTQIHDFRTLQDHHAEKTTSELLFKGVLTDTARSVYSGLIRIRLGASGSEAFQTNRNLVLGEGAHADSVPNLEIEENDVKCSHASAVGPVDADQQYYLEARGVPSDVAERLIVLGFFDDVLDKTPVAELRAPLRAAVAAKLAASGASG